MHHETKQSLESVVYDAADQVKELDEQFSQPGSGIFICSAGGIILSENQQAAAIFNAKPATDSSIFSFFKPDFESFFEKTDQNQSQNSFSGTFHSSSGTE